MIERCTQCKRDQGFYGETNEDGLCLTCATARYQDAERQKPPAATGQGADGMRELEKRVRELEGELDEWRNKEASCCPEDTGFVEFIQELLKREEQLIEDLSKTRLSLADARSLIAVNASPSDAKQHDMVRLPSEAEINKWEMVTLGFYSGEVRRFVDWLRTRPTTSQTDAGIGGGA